MEIRTSFKTKFVFNGQEYNSIDEMPEDVRRLYRDTMALAAKGGLNVTRSSKISFQFGDKVFGDADQMPPEARHAYGQVMKKIEAGPGGVSAKAAPERVWFSIVSTATLIGLILWLIVIILRHS